MVYDRVVRELKKISLNLLSKLFFHCLSLVSRYKKIYIVHFPTASIGRLLPELEEYFSNPPLRSEYFIVGYFDKGVVNKLAADYIRSQMMILPNFLMIRVEKLARIQSNLKPRFSFYELGHGHFYPFSISRSELFKNDFDKFIKSREQSYLEVPIPQYPYATLCVREPTDKIWDDGLRNTHVKTFEPIIKYLLDRDFGCIRMSRFATETLTVKSAKVLDYPFSEFKSDFADFTLFKKSKFCISTGFGVDHFASFSNIPVITVNAPLMATYLRPEKRYFLPKTFVDSSSRRILSVEEILQEQLFLCSRDSELKERGVALADNDKTSLIAAIDEFIENNFFVADQPYDMPDECKRVSKERLAYHKSFFRQREKENQDVVDLDKLIIISRFWLNYSSAGQIHRQHNRMT